MKRPNLSTAQQNKIFDLHNYAYSDQVYGERLYQYLRELVEIRRLSAVDVDHLYILSVDWPIDVLIQPISS